MYSVNEIIRDAFDRTGIYPNVGESSLPQDMADIGLKLLKGLVSAYNVRNMIMSSQSRAEVQIPADGVISTSGENSGFDSIASVQKVMIKVTADQAGELEFVPFQDFDLHPGSAWVYSYRQNGPDDWEIYVKPGFAGRRVIVHYNRPFPCERDTEYSLPDEYRELFTLGLGVKLLTAYPRQDEKMRNYFVEELNALTNSITAKQGEAKLLLYNRYDRRSLSARGDAGDFLFGG